MLQQAIQGGKIQILKRGKYEKKKTKTNPKE
jgi:hypothetical protein